MKDPLLEAAFIVQIDDERLGQTLVVSGIFRGQLYRALERDQCQVRVPFDSMQFGQIRMNLRIIGYDLDQGLVRVASLVEQFSI